MTSPRFIKADLTGLLGFAALYALPIILTRSIGIGGDEEVRRLLLQAISNSVVQVELVRIAAAHVLFIGGGYLCIAALARHLSSLTGVRYPVWITLVIVSSWLALLKLNSALFPLSAYGLAFERAVPMWMGAVAGAMVLGLLADAVVSKAARLRGTVGFSFRSFQSVSIRRSAVLGAIALSVAGFTGQAPGIAGSRTDKARSVIVVGIDSLSHHVMNRHPESMPTLAALLERSMRFENAYTPMARTLPAWVSALSGSPPADHGAILNLRGLDSIDRDGLLTWNLKGEGYRTVHAIDERRFSNIDESFGFDAIVGPKAGVLDLVTQDFADNPLANLTLQTWVGRLLLPYSHLNVAAYASYDAQGFVDAIVRSLAGARRAFVAAHFESGHFPFRSRHASQTSADDDFSARQLAALRAVDSQVARLLESLADAGWMNEALLVIMSDHGEALGEVESRTTRSGVPYDIVGYGHGGNLLSVHENQIVLAAVQFKDGRPISRRESIRDLHSLSSVRGLVETFVATGELVVPSARECMTMETGVRLESVSDYRDLDERKVAQEGASLYELDRLGRLAVREERLADLIESKDVALRCRDRITLYTSRDKSYFAYLIDQTTGAPRIEVAPTQRDIAAIDAYRLSLLQANSK